MHTPPPSLLFSFFSFPPPLGERGANPSPQLGIVPYLMQMRHPPPPVFLPLYLSFHLSPPTLSLLSLPTHTGHVICLFSCDNSKPEFLSLQFFNYPFKQTRVHIFYMGHLHALLYLAMILNLFAHRLYRYVTKPKTSLINECHIGKLNLHLRLGCLQ